MNDNISNALQGRRYHTAYALTENSPAVLSNGHELEPSEIIPRYLAAEENEDGAIIAFWLSDSFEAAAKQFDISDTTGVAARRLYDLDTKDAWEADLRIIGFNLQERDDLPKNAPIPSTTRVEIAPATLSSAQPGLSPAKVLVTVSGGVADCAQTLGSVQVAILDLDELAEELTSNGRKLTLHPDSIEWLRNNEPKLYRKLQDNIVASPDNSIDAELEAGNRAFRELARHAHAMGSATATRSVTVNGTAYEVIVRALNTQHPLPAITEEHPILARTLTSRDIASIQHALRSMQYNALGGRGDACTGTMCSHFHIEEPLDPYELSGLIDSIVPDSLILVS